jgi:hypothetical protein
LEQPVFALHHGTKLASVMRKTTLKPPSEIGQRFDRRIQKRTQACNTPQVPMKAHPDVAPGRRIAEIDTSKP